MAITSPPSNLTVSNNYAEPGETLLFTWKAASGTVSQYRLYGTRSDGQFTTSVYVSNNTLKATTTFPTNIPNGGYVNYRVEAVSSTLYDTTIDAHTENITVWKKEYTRIDGPKNFALNSAVVCPGDVVTLTWTPATGDFDFYKLYLTVNGETVDSKFIYNKQATSSTLKVPTNIDVTNDRIWFRIVAIRGTETNTKARGDEYSTAPTFTTLPAAPYPITVGEVERGQQVNISWGEVKNLLYVTYTLERSVNGGAFVKVYEMSDFNPNHTTYIDTDDNSSWVTVQYRVKSSITGHESGYTTSPVIKVKEPPKVEPEEPFPELTDADFDNKIYVYDKNMNLLAVFDGNTEGLSPEAMQNLMIAPRIHLEQNNASMLTFQMLANCEKWQQIKDVENIFVCNGRYYTALSESAYVYNSEEGVRTVDVSLFERWALLDRQYTQIYNCGIYVYAKAHFIDYESDGARFRVYKEDGSSPSNMINKNNVWSQIQAWNTVGDDNETHIIYNIVTLDEYKPTKWENYPTSVIIVGITEGSNYRDFVIQPTAKTKVSVSYAYNEKRTYELNKEKFNPVSVSKLLDTKINYTMIIDEGNGRKSFETREMTVTGAYSSNAGIFTTYFQQDKNTIINSVTFTFEYLDLGNISSGATCTFGYGAEVVDEHTVVILPKSKSKYKLTIDGVQYEDSQVKDQRGFVLPRGSAGYALWALLKNTGWRLGICDVIAKGFDTSKDYGCFNIESDMKDVLYNIQYIQQLYGGILCWDSKNKILHYRAENNTDYQSYDDDFNKWKGYEFREGKNMTEQPVVTIDSRLITRGYILGYGNLNIKAVNDGKSYIDNFSYTKDIYEDYLSQPLIYDTRDEGGQKQLLYWGKKELAKMCKPRKHLELTVTDIRTVEGYEHEVFDINDVVRVYYRDEHDRTQVMEEQRVILWEYNVFAMWDCTVELGYKVKNLSEMFELVYNTMLDNPKTNGNGQISGSDITIDGSGTGDENSLIHYIELIARTTTDNSDAIAGLILDTNEYYAKVDLFAYYQKQLDDLLTKAYAGLTFYADEKKAEAIVSSQFYADQKVTELDGKITQKISQTEASLKTYADAVGSRVELIAQGYYKEMQDGLTKLEVKTAAGLLAEQNQREALAQLFADYQKKTDSELVETSAMLTVLADDMKAQAQLVAQYKKDMNQAIASFDMQASDLESYIRSEIRQLNKEFGELYTGVNQEISQGLASVTVSAISNEGGSQLYMDSRGYVRLDSTGGVDFSSAGEIRLGTDRGRVNVYIRDQICHLMRADIRTMYDRGQTIYYFGWYDYEDPNN